MCDKMGISAYILKIVEKDPFLRLQMRAKEMFNLLPATVYNCFFSACMSRNSRRGGIHGNT